VKSKTTVRKRAPARPPTQQQPTPERNREIQQALIDKGYLQDLPTGVWGPQSSDALKRFQADQQLQPTGKLDSLSLIRLGLGPKRQALTPASLPNSPESTAKP
jgi:peptidoglycan hydrolase-like protein with peptidoglycan-binding domain